MIHNTNKIAGYILVSSLFITGATPVFAQTPSPTLGVKAAARAANMTDRLKERAATELTRRLTALNNLISRITSLKRLTSDQKTSLTTQVQSEISDLTTLQTKISGDTDIATLRTDVQSIVKSYRIFALFIPKMTIISHADNLIEIANLMTEVSGKLQTRLDAAKSAGNDTTAAQSLMTDRAAKIADAIAQATSAMNTVLPLTPDGYPGNKTTLQSARTMLVTARHDLQTAQQDADQVRQQLRSYKKTVTLTPTP